MEEVIGNLKKLDKVRTVEAYTSTLNSFRRFREERDVPLDMVDSDMVLAYEAYLKANGVSPNSSSFYMRNLRAVYNRAVEKELTPQRFPFKHVYTGVDKTIKRAMPLKVIKKIKEMDLELNPSADFARDMGGLTSTETTPDASTDNINGSKKRENSSGCIGSLKFYKGLSMDDLWFFRQSLFRRERTSGGKKIAGSSRFFSDKR